jgi:hypothetical protein
VPYSRDYKRKYEFFRRKLKKQVGDVITAAHRKWWCVCV